MRLKEYEFWLVIGSQSLYGPEVLETVAARGKEMAAGMNADGRLPCRLIYKATVKSQAEVTEVMREANYDVRCAGVAVWMHTFSPAKLWINGLSLLQKPYCHLATQYSPHIPDAEMDMRSSMLEVVGQDYIKTAKSKGLSNFRITVRHEIRNAIIPIITIMGPTVASILTGTFVIESIFAIPGMGKYYVDSINANDYTLIMGMTIFYGAVLILANMIVDILYGIVDPRIRVDKKSEA